jgi:predicted ATPase
VTSTAGNAPAAAGGTASVADPAAQRLLVLIGGLPGAGKTRLLGRLLEADGDAICGLDSEYVADRLRDSGIRLPYRVLRPAVHAWHRLTVRRVVRGRVPVVVVTDPLTSARRRGALVAAGRRSGRRVRVLLLDVRPEAALRGQERRHRTVGARSMARHARGWRSLLGQATTDGVEGADRTVVLGRDEADRLSLDDLLG